MTGRWLRRIAVAVLLGGTVLLGAATPAAAAPNPPAHVVTAPSPPAPPGGPTGVNSTTGGATVGVQINGPNEAPSYGKAVVLGRLGRCFDAV